MKDTIIELIIKKDFKSLKKEINDVNEVDLADILSNLEEVDLAKVIRVMPKDKAARVFSLFDGYLATKLLKYLSDAEIVNLIDEMAADDATDLLEEMPANIVARILRDCKADTRKDINKLLNYADSSAGSIMTVEYPQFKENISVSDAIAKLKRNREYYETIHTCYVVSSERILLGRIGIEDLLFSDKNLLISDVCNSDIVYVNTTTDQEEVASYFKKYDFTVMPVVDSEKRLVGIITVDDVIDVIEEEVTEDIKKMAAIIPDDKPYSKTGVFDLFKARIPWLLLLMVSATFTGGIIKSFEAELASMTILTAFIPMLMDTGGNAGGQASVSIIRALSLNDIKFSEIFRVWWKEVRVAFLCSIVLGICNFIKFLVVDKVTVFIALTVCLTLFITIILAKSIGCMLPMLAKRVGFDPAVMASPFITTIVDACSLLIYFQIASAILGI